MTGTFDHERPFLLVLEPGEQPAAAFEALLSHPDVAAWQFPAPWAFEEAGVDLLSEIPRLGTITRENLDEVLDALVRLHTRDLLEQLCRRLWRETSEQVRGFFLKRSVGQAFASIFRFAPKSKALPPPPDFVQGQVYVHRFELQYRLRAAPGRSNNFVAPPEEGSLVLYPFDPANHEARAEAHLDDVEDHVVILEAFAYAPERAWHLRVLEEIAESRGWRVLDTAESPE